MNISKTTFNMAKKRGLELTVETNACEDATLLCIWEAKNDCEWLCSYRLDDSNLTWNGNIYLPQEIKQELPGTIDSEKRLREVVDYIASNRHMFN